MERAVDSVTRDDGSIVAVKCTPVGYVPGSNLMRENGGRLQNTWELSNI